MPLESPRSTLMFTAQARSYNLKVSDNPDPTVKNPRQETPKKVQPQRLYSLLPKHVTPVRRPIKNPFNERLVEVFNGPTCSPDFCSSFASPVVENTNKNEFFWTAEDLWRLDPAPIDSPQTDHEDNLDEETETLAQEAIERYFQESHNILSPIGSPKSTALPERGVTPDLPTPQCLAERAMSTPCTRYDSRRTLKTTTGVQTSLSFCSDIPDYLLDLLRPFTNSLDESKIDLSDSNSSNLRRKLTFNWDSPDNSDDETNDANKKITSRFLPSDWTPDKIQSTLELFAQSPDISPIADGVISRKTDYFNMTTADSSTSADEKSNVCHTEHHHMSIDLCAESTLDSLAHQNSHDTGYHTISSDRSDKLRPTSSDSQSGAEIRRSDETTSSYIVSAGTMPCDTGVTFTPTLNQ